MAPANIIPLDLLCWGEWGWTRHLHKPPPTSVTLQFSDSAQGCLPSELTVVPEGLKALRDGTTGGCQRRSKPQRRFAEKGEEDAGWGLLPEGAPGP